MCDRNFVVAAILRREIVSAVTTTTERAPSALCILAVNHSPRLKNLSQTGEQHFLLLSHGVSGVNKMFVFFA